MSLSVFNQKVLAVSNQLVNEQINLFNAATGGALILGNGQVIADFVEQSSFGLIAGLVTERNPYAPAGTDAELKVLAELLANSVNLSGKVGPFVITTGMMEKINRNAAQVAAVVSAQSSQGIMQQYLKAALGALNAAMGSNAAATYTQPARTNPNAPDGSKVLSLADFPLAASKFGDAAQNINTWIMDGVTWANFLAYQVIPNVEQLFTIGNIGVMGDGLGRRFVVSDALSGTAGVADTVLGLVSGAAAVSTTGVNIRAGERLGGENIENIIQGEFSYNVSLKGYKLKAAQIAKYNGRLSPKMADILDKTNWETLTGNVDNAPYSIDQYDSNHNADGTPVTGAKAPTGTKKQQAAQSVVAPSIKDTAGVVIRLTGTKVPAAATTNA